MSPVTDNELFAAFAQKYPQDLVQLSRSTPEEEPYDFEATSATEKYQGVAWERVDAGMLKECYDIPLLFSPKAFHYFFPAFIRQSQLEYQKLELFADSLVFFIADSNDDWSKNRWLLFSLKQLELVLKWLNWLSSMDDFSGARRIPGATKYIQNRIDRMLAGAAQGHW